MSSDVPGAQPPDVGYRTIWAPERAALTVALSLPGFVVSATITGWLGTIFFPLSTAVTVAAVIAVCIIIGRTITWTRFTARRVIAVSDTHLAVRSRSRTLTEMPWDAIASIELVRGSGLLRTTFDVLSDDADFPYVLASSTDVWDVRGMFPTVLASLPSELRCLESALVEACAARSVPFGVRPQ
ncbi:hypothetical protein [Aeromicrobium fastidiosum]|uniref:Uncharacterized protein n=1 Tax=Aeromicrobium fastidiosum TaxID=52699 RepID=A0A641AHH8_9ACTN|nr:hypothetical protein [Aeromicrobium fastidiosum]KAA1372956.1 hypothetical protein ESP62_017830 [Aeromicrobium fastidiosum]MBP2390922.1 hypothetical protein [Aeromicrobium fastidiosum]